MKRLIAHGPRTRSILNQVQLNLQVLEDRTVPNTYTVTQGGDSLFIKGTLRDAIEAANKNAGADTIVFSGKGATGTITLGQGELLITDSVTIDGPGTLSISGGDSSRVFNISGLAFLSVSISDLTISNGNTTGRGGGVWNQGELLTLANCTLINNTSTTGGGGLSSVDGTVIFNSCVITGNSSSGNGGGIDVNTDAILTVRDTTVAGNVANGAGGGIGVGSSSIFIERSTISGNSAASAGGIYVVGTLGSSGANIRHSTLSGNTAKSSHGGGLRLNNIGGTLTIDNTTITANHASNLGGGIYQSSNGSLDIESSIIAKNTASSYADVDNNNFSATLKTSAVSSTNGFKYSDLGGNLAPGVDLKLGPLASNGGLTQTHLLLTGSPCIDVGSNPLGVANEQRSTGYPRILSGKIDIGATEHLPSVVTNSADSGMGSLRQTILDANLVAGASSITFDPVAFASQTTIALTGGQITIADALTIQGPGAALALVSGNNTSRVFLINGGGIVPATISGLTITHGKIIGSGGAIYSAAENVTLSNCIISNSMSTGSGGGVGSSGGSLTLVDCVVTSNQAGVNGGGVDGNSGVVINIRDSTVANNKTTSNGGGISLDGALVIDGSTLSGNSANLSGGGVSSYANVTIRNSTISGNAANTVGGGVRLLGQLIVQNSTITANSANAKGGGIYQGTASTINLDSSIIQLNISPEGLDVSTTGAVTGKTTALGSTLGFEFLDNGGNLIGQDIKLGTLADNGGPTLTHALMKGSPCIDAGSNPIPLVSEQRGTGFPRLVGGIADMGALEFGRFLVTNANDNGPGSLRQMFIDANVYPGADFITFDPVVFAMPQVITLTSGELLVTDSFTIQGPGATLARVSGNKANRVFNFNGPGVITATISGLTITDGKATGNHGGAILNQGELLSVSYCEISTNTADGAGGAIASFGGPSLLIDHCDFVGNQTLGNSGGVLYGTGAAITIRGSSFTGNQAKDYAGALFCYSDNLLIEGSSITGNTAHTGAGITPATYSTAGLVTIRNSTISGNMATNGAGGGIAAYVNGLLIVQNSTITANSSATKGGGIHLGLKATVESTIVQVNTAPMGSDIFTPDTVTASKSAFGSIDGIAIFDNDGGNLIGQDIKLGPLADNGGPTLTHALLAGSPCINTGSNPVPLVSDQRGQGFMRLISGVADIGAIEFGGLVVTNVNDNGPGSLRQTVIDANAYPGLDTITFDAVAFASQQVITLTSGEISITDSLTIQGPAASLSTVSGNKSSRVFYVYSAPSLIDVTITGLTISQGNAGSGFGGGILSFGENVAIERCVFDSNSAFTGGALRVYAPGKLSLSDSKITNNSANNNAGGIVSSGGATIQRSTISGNTAINSFGGIYAYGGLNLLNSTVSGNTGANGGGLALFGAASRVFVIHNSTISGNATSFNGGGIALGNSFLAFNATLTVQNTTITNNSANTGSGGGIARVNGSGLIDSESSILQGNSAMTGPDIFTTGPVSAKTTAFGFIDGISTYINKGGNLIGQNIMLGPLADNGGPTKTHAPLPGSPLIGGGSNSASLTTDQRGAPREYLTADPDIGALEVQPPPHVLSVIINDGSMQRSLVTSLTITFDQVVALPTNAASAIQLIRQISDELVDLSATVNNNGTTSVTLSFIGGSVNNSSLADGRYTLTIDPSKVTSPTGNLDGDNDGTAGGKYELIGDPATNKLFRLFGDSNGDGTVTSPDFAVFRSFFGLGSSVFDFNADNLTNSNDFAEFRKRFGLAL